MKMIYISFINEELRPGYRDKIHSQAKAFNKYFDVVYLYALDNENYIRYEIKKTGTTAQTTKIKHKRILSKRNAIDELIILKHFFKTIISDINKTKIDFAYIRRIVPITPILISTIRKIKNKGIYVAYEYPTWPWKNEMKVTGKNKYLYIDSLLFKKLKNSVNQLAVYGQCKDYDPKIIETMNGVDIELYKIKKENNNIKNNKIVLIAVGHIMPQHGYDKVIKGIHKYYSGKNEKNSIVEVNIVGTENTNTNLKSLAESLKVDKYVHFYGFKKGEELDEIFNKSNIGVDCLALNRIQSDNLVGSLKSREYLARGIPFIFAGNLDFVKRMNLNKDFIIEVDENKDYIDIEKIINKYKSIKTTKNQIRSFAKNNLSWEAMLYPIVEKYMIETGRK